MKKLFDFLHRNQQFRIQKSIIIFFKTKQKQKQRQRNVKKYHKTFQKII